ncbi:MAG: hypothetical protein FWE57_12335 [Chitinispirillia bacterium]|nr:hypothetical protein [Chitinispirillia bacterium]
MKWDNIDWDNFSCVDMTRKIKNEIDAKFADMTGEEIVEYLRKTHLKFNKSLPPRNTLQQQA